MHEMQELETVISSIADGIVIYGSGGEILRMNEAARQMLGYSEFDVSMPISERVKRLRIETADGQPFDDEELPFVKALRGETASGTLMRLVHSRSEEKPRWVSVSSAPIHASNGEISGAVATFTDITDLHDLSAWQQDLVRAVSHDLRTPLTAIIGNAQLLLRMLQRTGAEERYISNVGAIVQGAGRMDRMITDLVESARLESGQLPVEKQLIDLSEFVQELLRANQKSLNVDRVRVETTTDGNRVCVDPHHLDRILTNLISNALKYSDPDTEVRVGTERRNGDLVISVADQGQGIPSQDMPHLFDRFYRVKGARKAEGLGLGLYITRMLVEAQGGRISVESEPGSGSTFFVTLPTSEGSSCS